MEKQQLPKDSRQFDEHIDKLTPEQLKETERLLLPIVAQEDDANGFEAFYKLIFQVDMPKHVRKWTDELYEARENKIGFSLQAFRGSTKTTFMIGYILFQMGKHPEKASMVIQVSDDKANKFTNSIAGIIENSPGWKAVYPHIVPDKQRGWSSNGYEIKDDSIPYGEWVEKNSKRVTPSIVGCGWQSGLIVGFHPDLILLLDDILDRNNTDSLKNMEAVRETIKASINPAATKDCYRMMAFTPWKENDPVLEQSMSGNYKQVKTPIYSTLDLDAKYEWNGIRYTPTWMKYGKPEDLQFLLNESGRIEFARMYLLDLSQSANRTLKYHSYPSDKISPTWIMGGGVDYAGARSNLAGNTKNDYFAMAYIAKIPEGGCVITGGVLERGTQASAETHVNRAQEMFPGWTMSCVESDGKGEEFIQLVTRNPNLRILPKGSKGIKKETRILQILSPYLESGQIRISDEESLFLNELRKELDEFPDCEHDDALDAVYYSMFTVQDALKAMINVTEEFARIKLPTKNPYAAFGRR